MSFRRPALLADQNKKQEQTNGTLPMLAMAKNLNSDVVAYESFKHHKIVQWFANLLLFAPISYQAREGSREVINNPSAIPLISSLCDALIGDIRTGLSKSLKTGSPGLAISDASWAALEELWDKCGVPAEDWRVFKESAQAAGMTWDMLAPVAAAQILEASSTKRRQQAALKESLGEQMRKMANGANPNIRVHSSIGESVTGELIKNPGPDLVAAFAVLFMVLCYALATGGAFQLLEEMSSSFDYLSSAVTSAGGVVGTVASKPAAWVWLSIIIRFIQTLNSLADDD